jgi:hypothetical protein
LADVGHPPPLPEPLDFSPAELAPTNAKENTTNIAKSIAIQIGRRFDTLVI